MADKEAVASKVGLATEDDIPELVPIFWEAFSGPAESTFPHTDGGRKWLERSFANFLGSPSYYHPESKMPVVRNANGRFYPLRKRRSRHGRHAFLHFWLLRRFRRDIAI
jgi:hypothetical protein